MAAPTGGTEKVAGAGAARSMQLVAAPSPAVKFWRPDDVVAAFGFGPCTPRALDGILGFSRRAAPRAQAPPALSQPQAGAADGIGCSPGGLVPLLALPSTQSAMNQG
jgi:hypothetical protein